MMVRWLLILLCMLAMPLRAEVQDPLERLNRKTHAFNEVLDARIAKPVARAYVRAVPEPIQLGVSNFFGNLNDVNVMVNDLLQLKLRDATGDFCRILVNSTLGLGGLFDPAADLGLRRHEEDWGQTLAAWRFGEGAYVVLPLLGPSTVGHSIGRVLDSMMNPLQFLTHVPTRNSLYLTDQVQTRAELLDVETLIIGEKYVFLRDAYLQRRDYLINDGEVADQFEDDF